MRFFFFFKQKTAYEMRISDWSSDVCSSDLSIFRHVLDAAARAALVRKPFAMTKRAPAKRPPIHMIDSEADTLTDLALARQDQSPALAALLLQEIDRAKIYTAPKIPADIVTMPSRVQFLDEGNGRHRPVDTV